MKNFIMTVLGPIQPQDLGVTLAHEHLFIDLRNQFTEPQDPERRAISHQSLQLDNLGRVRRNPYALQDNLVLNDLELAEKEIKAFKKAGGRSIVDCTPIGIGRDAVRLKTLSRKTGVHIIAGSGFYTADTHPESITKASYIDLAEEMTRDFRSGIDNTNIKAGVIGEIGTSSPIHPDEEKVLRAAALTQLATNAGIQVHTYPWAQEGMRAIDILLGMGVKPEKVVICHVDILLNLNYIKDLLSKGVFVEFDNFGKEFAMDVEDFGFAQGHFPTDRDRIHTIKLLVDQGYGTQILVTNDICLKCMLLNYGGWGYSHILEHVIPMMRKERISEATIIDLLQNNPVRFLQQST